MKEKKVNVFIVGAMRAGTTSLFSALTAHKNVYATPIKEPNYFVKALPEVLHAPSYFRNEDRYFSKTFPKFLHLTHITKAEYYKTLYSLAKDEEFVLIDASTAYMQSPEAAHAIQKYNPNAKIIIVLRNPIERAYSHYLMDKGLGRTKRSFEEAIQFEIQQYWQGQLPWSSYLGMSSYGEAKDRFQTLFKDVLVLDYDILVSDGKSTLTSVFRFLGIEESSSVELPSLNASKIPRYPRMTRLLSKWNLKEPLKQLLGEKVTRTLGSKIVKEKESYQLSVDTLSDLKKILKVD